MAAPTIYRSSDVGAPVLTGAFGTLRDVLDACLVNGYGGAAATVTITSDGTTVADGETITIDGVTYTWKTALTPTAGQVLIGASAATNLSNLAAAISGFITAGTNYATGTTTQPNVIVTALTATTITLQARVAGTAGNSIAISKSATHISLSGATLSGGSAGSVQTSQGWAKSFSGTQGAVYRQAAGKQFYLYLNDNGPGGGGGKEARVRGAETATAYNADTSTGLANLFPTAAQRSTGIFVRKSSTPDQVARPWILIADARTFYFYALSGDVAGGYMDFGFGDFYSLLPADAFNCMIGARTTENAGTALSVFAASVSTSWNTSAGIFAARAYTGSGGGQQCQTAGDTASRAQLQFPNPIDGCVYLSRVYISPNLAATAVATRHGYFRGLYEFAHAAGNVVDGDTLSSSAGEFIGKSFITVKGDTNLIVRVHETTAWDTSV